MKSTHFICAYLMTRLSRYPCLAV